MKKHQAAFAFLFVCAVASARDNGDGTYTNPVIDNDAPDTDVLRVGDDFYYQQSTFHFLPGNTIYHSKDLVNWRPVAHSIPSYKLMGEQYAYTMTDGGRRNAYGRGSWAPTLKYHDGVFYSACYVWKDNKKWGSGPDMKGNGLFLVSRAKSIEGPWEMNAIDENLYDPGLFFDDDGRVYVFHGQGKLYVTELDKDLRKVKTPAKLVIPEDGMCEGSHAYKRNGYYYFYNTWGGQHIFRSKDIYGPYEHKELLSTDMAYPASWLHQGALVDTPSGEWWTVIFQDRGKYGREPWLMPVEWVDDWPAIQACRTHAKPVLGNVSPERSEPRKRSLEGWERGMGIGDWRSDSFSSQEIGLQWQWNHEPDPNGWSLAARPGFLRLKPTVVAEGLRFARNTLAQPPQDPDSGCIAKIDVSNLGEGDYAGLGMLASWSTFIGVTMRDGKRYVQQVSQRDPWLYDVKGEFPIGRVTTLWLKAEIPEFEFSVKYSFSLDGKHFVSLADKMGIPYNFFADWLGPRYCLFCYATEKTGGWADFDKFTFIHSKRTTNLFTAADTLDAQNADAWSDMSKPDRFVPCNDGAPHLGLTEGAWGCGGELSGDVLGWRAAFRARENGAWLKFNRVDLSNAREEAKLFARGEGKVELREGSPEGALLATFEVRARDEYATARAKFLHPTSPFPVPCSLFLLCHPAPGAELRIRSLAFKKD